MGDNGRWLKLGDLVIDADTIVGVRLDAKWSVVVMEDRTLRQAPSRSEGGTIRGRGPPPRLVPRTHPRCRCDGFRVILPHETAIPRRQPRSGGRPGVFAVRGGASEDVKLGAMLARHEGSPEGTGEQPLNGREIPPPRGRGDERSSWSLGHAWR